jgi:hypothetical protein
VAAAILTGMVAINYTSGTSYNTGFNIDTETGLTAFPDLLVCTSSPWDLEQAETFNISANLLSYLTYFLFPFEGFGVTGMMLHNS